MANETTIVAKICLRQGDNTYCNQFNGEKLLLEGEPLFNTSTNVLKIGKKDGNNLIPYNQLPSYYLGSGTVENLSYNEETHSLTLSRTDNTSIETIIPNTSESEIENIKNKIEGLYRPNLIIESKAFSSSDSKEFYIKLFNPFEALCGLQFILHLDGLECTEISTENISLNFTPPGDLSQENLQIIFDGESADPNTLTNSEINILKIKFNSDNLATKTKFNITITDIFAIDNNLKEINLKSNIGKIILTLPPCGDTNNDGLVNSKDIAILRRYIAGGYGIDIREESGDTNGDEVVNTKDTAILRRYLAGGYDIDELPHITNTSST